MQIYRQKYVMHRKAEADKVLATGDANFLLVY